MLIHNSLTRQKERFEPRVPGEVGMYVCGMTVYDLCHVGHARVLVVFDVLNRHLRASGFRVRYVRNITDIDDKIIARAAANGETVGELTQRYIDAMHQDADALAVLRPDEEPRATAHIDGMIRLISRLLETGHAYTVEGSGDVYYAVKAFEGYGKLSGRNLDEMRSGERVVVDEFKRDPLDFVLWKAAQDGEPSWPAPWGAGRPGWHIECSAMSMELLGQSFDIHGGGMDLKFPHHENEIAQSEAASGCTLANYWMHNGFVRIDDEKMSKSLGNFFTVREVLQHYSGEELRLFILGSHYRSPLNYSDEQLQGARAQLRRLYTAMRDIDVDGDGSSADPVPASTATGALMADASERFVNALDDDLNTPIALSILHELAAALNRAREARGTHAAQDALAIAMAMKRLGSRLGLLQQNAELALRWQAPAAAGQLDDAAIEALLAERDTARAAKDFARSDAIRDQLAEAGIVLEDSGGKTTWRRQ